jgi:hypothetical protein
MYLSLMVENSTANSKGRDLRMQPSREYVDKHASLRYALDEVHHKSDVSIISAC